MRCLALLYWNKDVIKVITKLETELVSAVKRKELVKIFAMKSMSNYIFLFISSQKERSDYEEGDKYKSST